MLPSDAELIEAILDDLSSDGPYVTVQGLHRQTGLGRLGQQDPAVVLLLAICLAREGKKGRLGTLIEAHPHLESAILNAILGDSVNLVDEERLELACRVLRIYVSFRPGDIDSRYNYAVTLRDCGESKRAITVLSELAKYSPASDVFFTLGNCYSDLGKTSAAIRAYLRSIEHDPSNQAAMNNLARRYLDAGEPHKALMVAKRAVQSDPLDPTYRRTYANALAAAGCFSEAAMQVRMAIVLGAPPLDAEAEICMPPAPRGGG